MSTADKVRELAGIITEALTPLVNDDYYLLECPYYGNIGDTLIWQGEIDFLKSVPHTCKGMHGIQTLPIDQLDKARLVLFQGGGNFGDLWTEHQKMKFDVMKRYPDYRYVFLPVTTHYESKDNLQNDADFLAHFDVTLCARDNVSYQFLKLHFKNPVILLPDMAFCIEPRRLKRRMMAYKDLLIRREDKEFKSYPLLNELEKHHDIDIMDWPTFSPTDQYYLTINRLTYRANKRVADWYCRHIFKRYLINTGINIIASHRTIYSTRLHAAILSILMGKENIIFFDNSYGKNSNYYDTWLSDCEAVQMIR